MNGTAQDLSGNNSNGTISGGVTPDIDRFGSVQSALRFNGSNGHITLPPGVYFNGSDFTVNVWVQKFSNNNWSRVFDFGNSSANQNILVGLSSTTTGRPAAQNYQGTSALLELVSVDVLPNNQWQMLTYTWSQNAGQLFIDGKLVAHGRQNTPSNVVRNLNYIGRSNWSGDGFANATFDEFRIYNKLLTFEDITTLLTQQPNPLNLTYNQTPICVGSSIVLTLNNTQRGMSYQLQNASTNANIGVAQIGTGQSLTYTLSGLTSTTNVRFSITNPSFSCNAVLSPTSEIILNSVVAAPLATGTSFCNSGSITLTASGAGINGSYNWYTTPTGGQPIINENDATFTTPIITISTPYYVSIVNNQGCESERTMITAIINNPLGPNVDLVNGLLLHYKFDGTTTDSSGNGINASFVGSDSGFSVDRNGNQNSAAYIGPSAYIDAGNPALVNQLTNRVTISMWVRQTQSWFGDPTPLLNKWNGNGMYIALDGFNSGNPQNRVRWRINNNTFVTSSVNVPNSTWTHIVCVYTGAQLRIYQNGVLTGQTAQTGNIPVTGSNLQIGRQSNGLGAIDYRGDLDEVKIYNRAMNVEEIRTLFNNESVAFANTPFCDGQGNLALTTFNFPGATYQWTGPNGFSSTQQNPTVIPNAVTQNHAGTYTLVVTDSNGCISAPQTIEAEINAFPVITEVANGTVCGSGSAVLSVVNPLPQTTYRWYVNEVGGTPIAGQTQATLTLTNVTQTTVRYVSAVKNNCEGARIAVSAIYFNNANISLAVTGSTVCSDAEFASVTIAATENLANYRLFYNGVVVSNVFTGGGTLVIPFNASVLSNGLNTITIQVNFPNCGVVNLTNQAEVLVNVPAAVTVSASGSLQLCPAGSVTLTATQGNQYLWSNGAITQSVTVSDAQTLTVAVTFANGCLGVSQPVAVTLNQIPVPIIVAQGETQFCVGGNVVLNASGGQTYLWSTGSTSNAITVTQSGQYNFVAFNGNCEASSQTITVIVDNLPLTPQNINGPISICGNETILYTIPAVINADGYLWVLPNGWSGVSSTNSIQVLAGSTGGTISVVAQNECGNSVASTINVSIIAANAVTVSASGSLQLCPAGSVTLTATQGTQYLWSNGATTQSVTVSAAQTLTVAVTFANGCSAVSQPVAVTLNQIPVPIIVAQGETQFCAGGNVVLNASGGQTYLWSTGSTSNAITVTQSGQYNFVAFNGNCEAASQTITVIVDNLPLTPQNINGPINSCGNETILYTIPAVINADGYLWVLPNGWSGVSSTNSIQVLVGSTGGTISVVAQNECGNSVASTLTISIIEINTAVNQNQNELLALAENAQFQWVNCETNTEIQGETNASFTPIQDGNYAVLVTQNGCSELSDCFQVQLLSIEDNQLFNHIVAFPNPVTDIVTIRLNSASSEPFKIKITNILGQELYEKNIVVDERNQLYLDFTNYPTGSYFVNLILNSEMRTIKIIKN